MLSEVKNEFHVIIDNPVVAMSAPATLEQMQQMVPYMNHPFLRWVLVVKPANLLLDTANLPIEQVGKTPLKNVASLSAAFDFLRQETNDLDWQQSEPTFFPNNDAI